MAQCTDNFGIILAGGSPPQTAFPLGVGSSLNALVSTINTVNTAFLTNSSAFVSAPGSPSPNQQGNGIWNRTVGGYADTKATSTSTLDFSHTVFPPAPGTGTCKGTVHQEYFGFQYGYDFSTLNIGKTGTNLHFGVTGGYFDSKSKDLTGAGPPPFAPTIFFPSGNFSGDIQVPFVGLYAVLTNGGFFADALVRFDFYRSSLSDPANGISGQGLNARGTGITTNVGYNIPLTSNWFIEPSAGIVLSRVSVDTFESPGTFAKSVGFFGTTFVVFGKGTVHFDDIESALGRASLRMGTTFSSGSLAWAPFVTASIFHEFAGNATATSEITAGGVAGGILNSSTSRIGTYGQFGLGRP